MIIDEASHSDIPTLCDLLAILFTQEQEFKPDPNRQRTALGLLVGNPQRGRVFVLRDGEKLFGMVSAQILISTACGGDVLLLEDLVVWPEYRNRGYGTALLEYVVDFARHGGYRRITLLADTVNTDAQRFYCRHGFFVSDMTHYRMLF